MNKSTKSLAILTLALSGLVITAVPLHAEETERTPAIVLTFAEGTESARLGTGGASDYEFSIDWGDGQEETCKGQSYYEHDLMGNTVKIYGDGILLLRGAGQGIISADMSGAPNLIQVMLGNNGMTSLTLGNHPSLTGLYAESNNLGAINVSGCPGMKVLDLHENAIEGTIDCSAMESLSKIDVADNNISSLILPKHSILYEVDCSNNNLTELDVTGLNGLDGLSCSGNQLTSIDLTGLTSVTEVYVDGNNLTTIDISPCSAIEKIMAAENEIGSIDLSQNPTLTGVYLQENDLTAIDITANPNIRWFNVGKNQISELDVTKQKNLSILIADHNNLSNVDLSQNTSISSLDLSDNNLTAIDMSKMGYLSQCHIENNQIASVDLSKNAYLYGLFCSNNNLTALDLSANTYLQRLEAYENNLTGLDITKNTGLQELLIQSNNMDKTTINSIIDALPDVTNVEITETTEDFIRQFNISHMPGTAEANVAAAQAKGWIVTADATPSSIDNIANDAEIIGTVYFNIEGLSSDKPFDGLNIKVDTMANGSKKTTKFINNK